MFEDSLMESGGQIKTKSKYWMIVSAAFWGTLLLITILIPLIYPEALPKNSLAASIAAPPPRHRLRHHLRRLQLRCRR